MTTPLRIAVVSTPRTGNTWIRHLVGTAYQIPHASRHAMTEADWAGLPAEFVLQIHWRRTPEFEDALARHGFRVVTVARHPFDVLISILHFCIYESESEHWLLGAGGTEADIFGAMPRSRTFLDYAQGPRAAELLGVTPDWWSRPGVIGLRYEDCVRDAEAELRRVEEAFGPVRCGSRQEAVAACAIGELRKGSTNNHFWKGSPGLWRQLLPAAEARELTATLGAVFGRLGYDGDPDEGLGALQADRNWVRLVGDEIKQTLRRNTEGHLAQVRAKDARIAELDARCQTFEKRLRESIAFSGPIARGLKRSLRRLLGRPGDDA